MTLRLRSTAPPLGLPREPLSMVVSPTRCSAAVLAALARPAPAYTEPEFLAALTGCVRASGRLLGTPANGTTLVAPGTGTLGLEALLSSLVPPGSRVLVLVTGAWGERWAEIGRRLGHHVDVVMAEPGRVPSLATVASRVAELAPAAVLATHVDSSTAVRLDLAVLAETVGPSPLLLVDGVCAAGADLVDEWQWRLDAYLATSAKAVAAPGGTIMVGLSARAVDRLVDGCRPRRSMAVELGDWVETMNAAARGRFHYVQSPSGSLIMALGAALADLESEGMTRRNARHVLLRDRLHEGLARLGLISLAAPELRAAAVSVVRLPARMSTALQRAVRAAGVVLPPSMTPGCAEETLRIGHLGTVTAADVDRTIEAIWAALEAVRG
jgi:alanine-glyoxylate transaminase / serine-glyoxylate transaminase / serine-pyruvate transaminase